MAGDEDPAAQAPAANGVTEQPHSPAARTPGVTPSGRLVSVTEDMELVEVYEEDKGEGGTGTRLASMPSDSLSYHSGGGGAPPARPAGLRQRLQSMRNSAAYIWWGLPRAGKATLVLAVINFVLSVVYAGVSIQLPDQDEELHITVTIVISSVFVLYTVADAVVYENTLELATSILLDTLVLARVVWFAAQNSANQAFKIAWCIAMLITQAVYIVAAVLAWREFGWRLYGKLGVDYREKGAEHKMRFALQRNAYITLLKINAMLMLVLCAIGIDVSVEKRGGSVYAPIMAVSISGLAVGAVATWMAARIVLKARKIKRRFVAAFHCVMPVALGMPVALIVIYNEGQEDLANANISINVSAGAYIFTSLFVWWGTQFMYTRETRAASRTADGAVSARSGSGSVLTSDDPILAAMHTGAWLGKPTQRNPYKIRFFQLSHDGSTLRWGWNKFVRLYYVEEMFHSDADLTLTLAFPFEDELILKCPDATTYYAWRRGLAHLLLLIMAPGSPLHMDGPLGQLGGGAAPGSGKRGSWVAMARTTSKGLVEAALEASMELDMAERAELEAQRAGPRPVARQAGGPERSLSMLRLLGVRVQEMGRRVAPKRWLTPQPQTSLNSRGGSRRQRDWDIECALAAAKAEGDAAAGSSGGLVSEDSEERLAAAAAERAQAVQRNRLQEDSSQLQKRQRMASYLQSLAATTHPSMLSTPPTKKRPPERRLTISEDMPESYSPPGSAVRAQKSARGEAAAAAAAAPRVFVSVGVQTEESELQKSAAAASAAAVAAAQLALPAGAVGAVGASILPTLGTPGMARPPTAIGDMSLAFHSNALYAASMDVASSKAAQQPGEALHSNALFATDSEVGASASPADRQSQRAQQAQQAQQAHQEAANMSGDGGLAAQYMAAMAAGGSPMPSPADQQQEAAPLEVPEGSADAGIAAQYLAAMAAAAGGAPATPAAGAAGPESAGAGAGEQQQQTPAAQQQEEQQQQQQQVGSDADVAAHYLTAMPAEAASKLGGTPDGAEPQPAAREETDAEEAQRSPQQAAAAGLQSHPVASPLEAHHSPSQEPTPRADASPAAAQDASPLEQLRTLMVSRSTTQQQQVVAQQLLAQQLVAPPSPGAAPRSPLEQLAINRQVSGRERSTPRSMPTSSGTSGLWQLATAVDVIEYEELSFGKMLGAGAEGAVYAAWFLESPVAVKKFEKAEDSLHEVEMYLQAGSHDNVVALRGLCQHGGSMYLVLEYCPRGTLDALLHHSAKNPWDPQKVLALIRSIARGMHYLHSRNILHRDLKPANIFVGHGQMMKIGDFGMARIVAPTSGQGGALGPPHLRRLTPGVVGTMQYCAPELLNDDLRPRGALDGDWALKLDVWSFGVTLWEVLERKRPFEGMNQHAVQAQWMADPYAARLPPVRLPDFLDRAGKRIFRGLSDLVDDCTRLDPYARPSFREILMRLKSLAAYAERGLGAF